MDHIPNINTSINHSRLESKNFLSGNSHLEPSTAKAKISKELILKEMDKYKGGGHFYPKLSISFNLKMWEKI
jgi:hypothetical protein